MLRIGRWRTFKMAGHTRFRLRAILRAVLCAAFVGFPYLVLFQTHGVVQFVTQASIQERWRQLMYGDEWHTVKGNMTELPFLRGVLERATTPDKTVIITTLNAAWASENSMVDLFLYSFQQGENIGHLVEHLVIVTLDEVSYERCTRIHDHCFRLRTSEVDFSGEKHYMSADYLKMMWRRIEFLQRVLELGYNFVFTDADIMWFRDPFPRFDPDADFQIACDKYLGHPTDLGNRPNGGFLYVRSNQRTVDFYKYWYASSSKYPHMHDQDVFDEIKGDEMYRKIDMKVVFLDTLYFGGFCEVSKDLEKVCTMHANCCAGLQKKLADLRRVLHDWKTFKDMSPLQRRMQTVTWKAPKDCVHSF